MTNQTTVQLARQRVHMRSGTGASGRAQIAGELADRPRRRSGPWECRQVFGAEGEHALCLTGPRETMAVSEHQRTVDPYGADIVEEKLK